MPIMPIMRTTPTITAVPAAPEVLLPRARTALPRILLPEARVQTTAIIK